jgi:hypothetical protein
MFKFCTKCKIDKDITDFHKKKSAKDGLKPYCRGCSSNITKEYYLVNKEDILMKSNEYYNINKEIILDKSRNYYYENKEVISNKSKLYYKENKEKIKIVNKVYIENNKEKVNRCNKIYRENNRKYYKMYGTKYKRDRRNNDPLYKLSCTLRSLISMSIKRNGYSKNSRTYDILGCTFDEFRNYLESQFIEGMNWENQGKWHLDHKIPISWGKTEDEIYKLNYYTNFQPLWEFDNLSKGNRYATV